jgi:hypothetical protein
VQIVNDLCNVKKNYKQSNKFPHRNHASGYLSLRFAVARKEANLNELNAPQEKYGNTIFAFDHAFFQVNGLNVSLKSSCKSACERY